MTEPAFPPEVAKALDHYGVPPVPTGFADRLKERAILRQALAIPLAVAPRRRAGPWKRAGRVVISVSAISLFTAAAAAGGLFGKPVYVPGITEVLEQTNVIEARPVEPAHVAKPVLMPDPIAIDTGTVGETKAKAALEQLRQDPDFQAMRPREKIRTAVKETRTLVKSGEITKQEGREALRDAAKQSYDKMTPEQQAQIKQRAEQIRERREQHGTGSTLRERLAERRAQRLNEENPPE